MRIAAIATSAAVAALLAAAAQAGELVINTDTSDPAPKQAFEELIAGFEAENPVLLDFLKKPTNIQVKAITRYEQQRSMLDLTPYSNQGITRSVGWCTITSNVQ